MINMETVLFIEMLNNLAKKTANGFMDWNSTDNADEINAFSGILFDSKAANQVVLAKCVIGEECPHKDITAYYDQNVCGTDDCITVQVKQVEATEEEIAKHGEDYFKYVEVYVGDGHENQMGAFTISRGEWQSEAFD